MPTPHDANAESSTAAKPSSSVNLDTLSPEALQQWRLNGDESEGDASAESSAASSESTDQTASTEATPSQVASDAAAPGDKEPKPETLEMKAETKKRFDALLAENAELKRRERERGKIAQPESKPKAATDPNAKPALKDFLENVDPQSALLTEEQFFETFPDAGFVDLQRYLVRHELASRDHAASQREAQRQVEEQREERIQTFAKRAGDGAFLKSLAIGEDALPLPVELLPPGTVPNARNIVAQEIMVSEHGTAMWQSLTVEDLATIDRMSDWASVVRFCARLESRVSGDATKAAKPAAPSKTLSDAPDPGTQLGSKAKSPADPVEGAIASDDFLKFRELENEREMAAFRK
jgi:hypothetical protein